MCACVCMQCVLCVMSDVRMCLPAVAMGVVIVFIDQ